MKITKTTTVSGMFVSILALLFLFSCEKDELRMGDVPQNLHYSDGETGLGEAYISATPTVFSKTTPVFSLTGVKRNGESADLSSLITINEKTGVIMATGINGQENIGELLVSVHVANEVSGTEFKDVFRLMVKGLRYDEPDVVVNRGEEMKIPAPRIFFSQQEGTLYSLVDPKVQNESVAAGFTIDPKTCEITVAASIEAGVYPLSIQVKNLTNPNGFIVKDALTVTVQSQPYGLVYEPSEFIIPPGDGFKTAIPVVKAASRQEGKAVVFALAENPQDQFTIDQATGQISLPLNNTLSNGSHSLRVSVTNNLGTTVFENALSVVIDPNKPVDPITAVRYPDTFPVILKPGGPWTSGAPTITGSLINLSYELVSAPQGVTIDASTGVITMALGHHMPLLTADNNLTVKVKNSGTPAGYDATVGVFSISAIHFAPIFYKIYSTTTLEQSGIENMDRYSFAGKMTASSSLQLNGGWGQSKNANPYRIDMYSGSDAANGLNNDWLVSTEIDLTYCFNPKLKFELFSQWGTYTQGILKLYIAEFDQANPYVKGPQEPSNDDYVSQPSGRWVLFYTDNEGKLMAPATSTVLTNGETFELDMAAFKGKKVRFAFHYYNETKTAKTYCVKDLRVEDKI